jgi:hypothetical protein
MTAQTNGGYERVSKSAHEPTNAHLNVDGYHSSYLC